MELRNCTVALYDLHLNKSDSMSGEQASRLHAVSLNVRIACCQGNGTDTCH